MCCFLTLGFSAIAPHHHRKKNLLFGWMFDYVWFYHDLSKQNDSISWRKENHRKNNQKSLRTQHLFNIITSHSPFSKRWSKIKPQKSQTTTVEFRPFSFGVVSFGFVWPPGHSWETRSSTSTRQWRSCATGRRSGTGGSTQTEPKSWSGPIPIKWGP